MPEQPPWDDGPSIMQVLRDAGAGASEVTLPDEAAPDPSKVRYGAGVVDGILGHHGSPEAGTPRQRRWRRLRWSRERPAPVLATELARLAGEGTAAARDAVYCSVQDDHILETIDAVLDELTTSPPEFWDALAPHARWLVDEGHHRGPVKLGIALLGIAGDESDLERLSVLARHDEFGLYCSVAFTNLLDDPVDALWATARAANGWGKIQAVEQLAEIVEGRPDVQRWLLTEGCANSIMDEYLGYPCAVGGALADALAGEVDDDLLDGACVIVSALCEGGPAQDMTDYAEGPAAVAALLGHFSARCDRPRWLRTVVDLERWLREVAPQAGAGWDERARLRGVCRTIIADPAWPAVVRATFDEGDRADEWLCWGLAEHVDVDLWDAGSDRLTAGGPDSGRVYLLATGATTRDQQVRLTAWAEATLPLAEIATGPAEHLFAEAATREAQGSLEWLLQQGSGWDGVISAPLIAAGARSPVIRVRYRVADLLERLPKATWGAGVEAAVRQTAVDDPDEALREQYRQLIAGGAGS